MINYGLGDKIWCVTITIVNQININLTEHEIKSRKVLEDGKIQFICRGFRFNEDESWGVYPSKKEAINNMIRYLEILKNE